MHAIAHPSAKLRSAGAGTSSRCLGTSAAARVAIGVLVVASLLIVAGASGGPSAIAPPSASRFPLWLAGPLHPLGLKFSARHAEGEFSVLVAVMFAGYLALVAGRLRLGAGWAIGAIVAVHVIFLMSPSLWGTDVFNYIEYARMGVLHGLNPYAVLPAAASHDPVYVLSNWHHLHSPYGELFTLFTYALVPLGIAGGFWALKVATMLASLAILRLVWRIAELREVSPVRAIALVGLNPLFVVYGLGGVHNDVFATLFVMLGIYVALGGRDLGAAASGVAAGAVKASSALILPFIWLGSPQPKRFLLSAIAVAAGAGLVSIAFFGTDLPAIAAQSSVVQPLSAPNLVGLLLGLGGETPHFRDVVDAVLVCVAAGLAWRTWRGADWLVMGGWAVLALLVGLGWQEPWYVIWVLPIVAVARSPRLVAATLAVSTFLMLVSLPSAGYVLRTTVHFEPNRTATGLANYRHYELYY